jgi:hypothetical protein
MFARIVAAMLLGAVALLAQAAAGEVEVRGTRVVLTFAGARELAEAHARELDELLARVALLAGDSGGASPPLQMFVANEERRARERALAVCQRELQGLGVLAPEAGTAVLCATDELREPAALRRALVHVAVQLAVAQRLPEQRQDELGFGWLAAGLSHDATTALPDGAADMFVVRDVLRTAQCWNGDFATAASGLVQQERQPALAALLATQQSDLDFAQHVAAFVLVRWLLQATPPPVTGERAVPRTPFARVFDAAREGIAAPAALAAATASDMAAVEARVHEFARRTEPRAGKYVPAPQHRPHPHAAIYLYATEPVRMRHRAVVDAALRRRHAALTSGWRDDDGKPRVRVGAVNQRAGFWHQDELVKPVDRTWPFVVVLEYEPAGDPRAYLECFRRPADARGDDGWLIDPGVGFVAHHNAQLATASDERFAYLAVPDTPTDSHVGGSAFVHRARVTWTDGRSAVLGLHTILIAPKGRPAATWSSQQKPLVDWRVVQSTPGLDATAVGALADPERELAIWGTNRVLPLPVVPPGLTGGRGRP